MNQITRRSDGTAPLFNWKKIRKECGDDQVKIDLFISTSKNELAAMLVDLTKKRKLDYNLLQKCSTQTRMSKLIGSRDEVWGEVHSAIASILERWGVYARTLITTKRRIVHQSKTSDLKLDSLDDIIGYYKVALLNNFRDIFQSQKAQKRSGSEISFYSNNGTDSEEDKEMDLEQTLSSNSHSNQIFNEYKRDIISYLRGLDRKNDTKLCNLFVVSMNPRYNGAVTLIQNRLGMNNKTFREQMKVLSDQVLKEFKDVSGEIIKLMDSRRYMFEDLEKGNKFSRQYENRKRQKTIDEKSLRPTRVNLIFGQKPVDEKNKKWVYYAQVSVDLSKTNNVVVYSDNWENIFKREIKIEGSSNQMSSIRPKLEKKIKKDLLEAQKLSEEKGVPIKAA